MRSAKTTAHEALAARSRDPWDEDDAQGDADYGPSWTKAYVGGMKVRQYAAPARGGDELT